MKYNIVICRSQLMVKTRLCAEGQFVAKVSDVILEKKDESSIEVVILTLHVSVPGYTRQDREIISCRKSDNNIP